MNINPKNVGHWCGLGGSNNPARMLAWALTEGGYEKVYDTNLRLAVEAGCNEVWIHNPAGNTRRPDGSANMEWDQFPLAMEDRTVPAFITPGNYVTMCRKLVAYRKSIHLTSYFGNPGWNAFNLFAKREISRSGWLTRLSVTAHVITDVPRHGICVDGLNEANPDTCPAEYDYLRDLKGSLTRSGRWFHGEHGGNIWWNPCWADVPGGVIPWSQIKAGSRGPVPVVNGKQKIGYAQDDIEEQGDAMLAMVEKCQSLGYTPLLYYPAFAKLIK